LRLPAAGKYEGGRWGITGIVFLSLLTVALFGPWISGCGGVDPGKALRECARACEAYASEDNYLRFREEVLLELESEGEMISQLIVVEGEQVFPDRQRYLREESWKGPKEGNSLSSTGYQYITVDGGRSAYVRGKKVESALGTAAWVYYTPPPGDRRYFDFIGTVKLLATGPAGLSVREEGEVLTLHFTVDLEEILKTKFAEAGEEWREELSRQLEEGLGRELPVEMRLSRGSYLPLEVKVEKQLEREGVRAYTRLTWRFSGYGEEPSSRIEPPAFYVKAG